MIKWQDSLTAENNSNKLRFFRMIKSDYSLEPYLNILNSKERVAVRSFELSQFTGRNWQASKTLL